MPGLTVTTTNGDIASAAGSTISSSNSLQLTSGNNIDLVGSVAVGAMSTTTLDANGSIIANNGTDNFGQSLTLAGLGGMNPSAASANMFNPAKATPVVLADVEMSGNLVVSAGGRASAQTVGNSLNVGGTSSFTTTTGSITLDEANSTS